MSRYYDEYADQEEAKQEKLNRKADQYKDAIIDGEYDQELVQAFIDSPENITKQDLLDAISLQLAKEAA